MNTVPNPLSLVHPVVAGRQIINTIQFEDFELFCGDKIFSFGRGTPHQILAMVEDMLSREKYTWGLYESRPSMVAALEWYQRHYAEKCKRIPPPTFYHVNNTMKHHDSISS